MRKSITQLRSVDKMTQEAIEDFKSISEVKYEMAIEAYEKQDAKTKAAIDKIQDTLRVYATGYINVQLQPPNGVLVPVKIDNEYLGYNLLFLAVEIVKNFAIMGMKLENFKFPPSQCVACGSDIIPEKRTVKR